MDWLINAPFLTKDRGFLFQSGRSTLVLVILITFFSVVSAEAGVNVEDYKMAKTQSWFSVYIGGIGQGISIANTFLNVYHQPTIYCPPEDKTLDSDDYISLIDAYLVKNRDTLTLETPISAVLLYALREAYPCIKPLKKRP